MKEIGDLDENNVNPGRDSSSCKIKSPKRTVHFADTIGLSLSSTHFFPAEGASKSPKYRTVKETNEARFKYETALEENEHGECAMKFLNFKSFQSNKSLQKLIEKQNVRLQQIMPCDSGISGTMPCYSGISGRILVRNLAFEKEVFVRYTVDSWLTYEEEHAHFIRGSSTAFADAFEFCIRLNQELGRKKMELAICYRVGENEFWDNNHGDNYRLMFKPSSNET